MPARGSSFSERGQALLLLLAVAAILLPLCAGFVSSMSLQDRLAGDRLRAATARYLAEAGIEKALWHLEGEAPNGSRDASWRPRDYAEDLQAPGIQGRFVVDVRDEPEGRISIESWGEVGRVRRGVRVVAKIGPGALDHALFANGLLAVDRNLRVRTFRLGRQRVIGNGHSPGRPLRVRRAAAPAKAQAHRARG